MKTWSSILALFAAISSTAVMAQAGRIDKVLVYPGGATVERVVAVKAGVQLLKITCLPARFDADSLQLRGAEGAPLQIGEISVLTADRVTQPDCAASPLDARIRDIEEKRAVVQSEIGAHELALGYLKSLGTQPTAAPGNAEGVRRTGLETLQRLGSLQSRRDEFDRQLAPLTAERERAVRANPQLRSVLVRVNAQRDGELRLSYRLTQAGWEPVYRAYLDTATGKVRLERHAQVAQNSGEDWNDVRLRLSTAQPRQSVGVPTPMPWMLDLLPPPGAEVQQRRFAAAPAPAPAIAPRYEKGAQPGSDLDFNISVFDGEFATEFEVPGRVVVASDGQRVAMTLGDTVLDARLMARTNPHSEAAAYLVAESMRPTGIWPAGNLQLFRDAAFVGQTRLMLGSQDKLDLFFGRDELIRVTAEPEQRFGANTGFIGTRVEQKIGHVYKVENLHQRPFLFQVLEASPVARHEDIKVQAQFDPKPTDDNWRKQPGIVSWEFTLAPGAAQRLSADYLISAPKDARIGGLR